MCYNSCHEPELATNLDHHHDPLLVLGLDRPGTRLDLHLGAEPVSNNNDPAREARKDRQFHSARDFEMASSQIGDVDPLDDEVKAKIQKLIAANAAGDTHEDKVADVTMLMRMLGVHPDDVYDSSVMTTSLSHPAMGSLR